MYICVHMCVSYVYVLSVSFWHVCLNFCFLVCFVFFLFACVREGGEIENEIEVEERDRKRQTQRERV